MSISDVITDEWYHPHNNAVYRIDFSPSEKTAYVMVLPNGNYAVAVDYFGDPIDEEFANVRLYSENSLLLLSSPEKSRAFASFCSIFVNPGQNDEDRTELEQAPLLWWKEWKSLIGNTNSGNMVYDVIGELYTIKKLLEKGVGSIIWNGPSFGTKDIETMDEFYEVKSTIVRDRKEITIHGEFQLDDFSKKLELVFCQFEPCLSGGLCINSLKKDIVSLGYDENALEKQLSKLGYSLNKSARNKSFTLLDAQAYIIDESFPKITNKSFIGQKLPAHIEKIDYTINLSGLPGASFM